MEFLAYAGNALTPLAMAIAVAGLVNREAHETVQRQPVLIDRVGDVAQDVMIVHLAHGAKRAPAIFVLGDGEPFAAGFLSFAQI